MLLVSVTTLLALYAGSYYGLSRRGLREAKTYGMKGFLYAPCDEIFQTKDLTKHYRLAAFYAPANWADRVLFGGEGPVRCILFGLDP